MRANARAYTFSRYRYPNYFVSEQSTKYRCCTPANFPTAGLIMLRAHVKIEDVSASFRLFFSFVFHAQTFQNTSLDWCRQNIDPVRYWITFRVQRWAIEGVLMVLGVCFIISYFRWSSCRKLISVMSHNYTIIEVQIIIIWFNTKSKVLFCTRGQDLFYCYQAYELLPNIIDELWDSHRYDKVPSLGHYNIVKYTKIQCRIIYFHQLSYYKTFLIVVFKPSNLTLTLISQRQCDYVKYKRVFTHF